MRIALICVLPVFLFGFAFSGKPVYYLGVDVNRGLNPVSSNSYLGMIDYGYVTDRPPVVLWKPGISVNNRGIPGPGLKLGFESFTLKSDISAGMELLLEFSSTNYNQKLRPQPSAQQKFIENRFELRNISIIPRIKIRGKLAGTVDIYGGIGVALSFLRLTEENIFFYLTDPAPAAGNVREAITGVKLQDRTSTHKTGIDYLIGLNWNISDRWRAFLEYDYLYLPQMVFGFDQRIEQTRMFVEGLPVNFESRLPVRDHYFKSGFSNMRVGLAFCIR